MEPKAPASPAEAYDTFVVPALFAPWAEELLSRAAPRSGERVLDVACGTGAVTLRLPALVAPTGKVAGLDISSDLVAVASRKAAAAGSSVDWRVGSGQEMPFDDGSFDLVLCQQGLQFFPDRLKGAAEIRRVLAGGGRAAIACWRPIEHQPVWAALGRATERHLGAPFAQPFSLGDAAELRAVLVQAGFRSVEIEEVSRTVRFPDPDRFATMSVHASAAVMPAFANVDAVERARVVEAVRVDLAPTLDAHTVDGMLLMPTSTHIATVRV